MLEKTWMLQNGSSILTCPIRWSGLVNVSWCVIVWLLMFITIIASTLSDFHVKQQHNLKSHYITQTELKSSPWPWSWSWPWPHPLSSILHLYINIRWLWHKHRSTSTLTIAWKTHNHRRNAIRNRDVIEFWGRSSWNAPQSRWPKVLISSEFIYATLTYPYQPDLLIPAMRCWRHAELLLGALRKFVKSSDKTLVQTLNSYQDICQG